MRIAILLYRQLPLWFTSGDIEYKMGPLNFAFVVHNHQPVDNKHEIIEKIYSRSYLPFVKVLDAHPQIRANLHYTGSLLDWLECWHPEFIDRLRVLVERGQVEMIGGAYYEPIISVIPDADSIGQISELRQKISKLFGIVPNGFWMAERAWEPQMPEILERSKVRYTLLDEIMLSLSGIDDSLFFKPYLVESRGKYTTVFPILRKLRKTIPYKSVRTILDYLKGVLKAGGELAVYADDGEKFGAWPHSYERVYKNGWLESFLKSLEKNSAWLNTVLLSDYLKENPALTRTYLSCASYPELMEWSLPASSDVEHAKGFWRLFLSKYPESSRMYSRMLRTSAAVHALGNNASKEMLHELWKGQCNDAYWHGVFGGLYLSILRRITYSHLIRAQAMSEEMIIGRADFIKVEKAKFDGSEEILVDTKRLGILASPEYGGSIIELDYKSKGINLFDTLARRQEKYHHQVKNTKGSDASKKLRSLHGKLLAKEDGLEDLLIYESGPRFSFLDHILKKDTTPTDIQSQKHVEYISPYAQYEPEIFAARDFARINFYRSFKLGMNSTSIQKMFELRKSSSEIEVTWTVKSTRAKHSYTFSPEINLGSLGDGLFAKRNLNMMIKHTRILSLDYPEVGLRVNLDFGTYVDVWQLPINTVSKSESGYERTLQCVSIMPQYEFDTSEILRKSIRMRISN